jgi:hypothetical protein
MWIFTTKGMFDLVANRDRKGFMIIKARCEADIWNLYNEHHARIRMSQPVSNELWDYRWGIHIGKNCAQRLVAELVSEIDYSLFKGAVHKNLTQDAKERPYLEIWARMLRVQQEEEGSTAWERPSDYSYMDRDFDLGLEYASRFDDLPAEPIKTIKSVTLGQHGKNNR